MSYSIGEMAIDSSVLYLVSLIGGALLVALYIAMCVGCCIAHLRRRNESYSRRGDDHTPLLPTRRSRVIYQRGAEITAATGPQYTFTISNPLTNALKPESDAIGETVNDRSLSNEPPPSYNEVQEQGTALPSYTEVIQENRLQKSINAAGLSKVTVAQEQRQLQETATTLVPTRRSRVIYQRGAEITRIDKPQPPCRDVT